MITLEISLNYLNDFFFWSQHLSCWQCALAIALNLLPLLLLLLLVVLAIVLACIVVVVVGGGQTSLHADSTASATSANQQQLQLQQHKRSRKPVECSLARKRDRHTVCVFVYRQKLSSLREMVNATHASQSLLTSRLRMHKYVRRQTRRLELLGLRLNERVRPAVSMCSLALSHLFSLTL